MLVLECLSLYFIFDKIFLFVGLFNFLSFCEGDFFRYLIYNDDNIILLCEGGFLCWF